MGIIAKILGKDKEKKADKAAKKGSRLPGPLGEGSRDFLIFRRGEKEAGKRGSRLRDKIRNFRK